MNAHQQLIAKFYTAFSQLQPEGMISCYHPDVTFYDPVFENLDATEVKAMWTMLCAKAKDFRVTFKEVTAEDEYGSCQWTAAYIFSATGRKVTNHVKARFKFQDGLIIEHMDDFDLWAWSRQALGFKGLLLGWSPFVQNRIRGTARKSLNAFLQSGKSTIISK